jgi:hypothetical protein
MRRLRVLPNRLGWLAALALLSACGTPAPTPDGAAPVSPAGADDPHIVAVLTAGDASIEAFDDAIGYLQDILPDPKTETHIVTARTHRKAAMEMATTPSLLARLQSLKPAAGAECLVYMTSHGRPDGFYMAGSAEPVTPADLDRALTAGCGQAPTIVVVSACYSGIFAAPPMTRPNRIILTAARPDRTSFGCGAGFAFTYFDECLLGALPNAPDWQSVYARTRGCVGARERQIDAHPSEPQAYFGDAAAGLPTPWRAKRPADARLLRFIPAPIGFKPSLVPISHVERERQAAALDQYGAAPAPKALAVTPGGFLSPVTQDPAGRRSEDDVARLAIERCEWLTGGACILFARDNRIGELMPSGMPPFHPLLLLRSGPLDAATMPFIRDDQRGEIAAYLAEPGPKALAVSPGQAEIGIGTGATLEAAKLDAIARCRAGMRDCVIYAENDEIVLGWGN